MDFIFQYGDFYNESGWFVDILIPLLGIMIPLFFGIWQFKRERKLERKSKKEEIINGYEDYTLFLVKLNTKIISQMREQVKHYKKFCENIQSNPLKRYGYDTVSHSNLSRATKLDTNYLLKVFRFHSIEKSFDKYLLNVDYLDSVNKLIRGDVYDGSGKLVTKYSNKFTEIRDKILFAMAEFNRDQKENEVSYPTSIDEVLVPISLNFYTNSEVEKPDVKRDKELINDKLLDGLLTEEHKGEFITNNLLNMVRDANSIVTTIKQLNEKLSEDLKKVITDIDKAIDELNSITKQLSKS